MSKITSVFYLLVSIILFTGCEKVVDLDLQSAESKLVVEANITNNPGPYSVKLTKSVPFDDASIYPSVSNAIVTISDNEGQKEKLSYTSDGVYKTKLLKGVEGRTYTLHIEVDGKTYNAQSTMPQKVELTGIKLSVLKFGGQERNVLFPQYTDPLDFGNNYNFVLTVNGSKKDIYVLWNDNTNNGLTNERPVGGPDVELESGDEVLLEMQGVDNMVYNYFFTLSQLAGGGPGGGTTPTNPPTNISGGALGIFSAHISHSKSIKIP
jgi:hypothetical protein